MKLQKGDTIAIVAPAKAKAIDKQKKVMFAKKHLEQAGFRLHSYSLNFQR